MSAWIYLLLAITGVNLVVLAGILIKTGGRLKVLELLEKRHDTCPVNTLVTEVAVISKEMDIFFKSVSVNLADAIRQHQNLERDELVDRMNHGAATEDELRSLLTLLRNDFVEARKDMPAAQAREVALSILLARVEQEIFKNSHKSKIPVK